MISKSRIYLTADRKRAVRDGDKTAQSLLVAKGAEISETTLAKYPGAVELAFGETPEPEKAASISESEPAAIARPQPKKHR